MQILIGNAWPYANGPLHIGHVASLLPGDVMARYHRAKGDAVFFVSGTDCHGTPVSVAAQKENKSPEEVSSAWHENFANSFRRLGFSYDRYGKTSGAEHVGFVRAFHRRLYESEYVFERETAQAFCETCGRFLPDRFLVGVCPECGAKTRGDQCDACGAVLESEAVRQPRCAICGSAPVFRPAKHLWIGLPAMSPLLCEWAASKADIWRPNAVAFTKRYLDEGLRERALTRDLDWGIDVPKEGYEGKKIYIWAENVLGYLSMSQAVCRERGADFRELWGPDADARHYYVHGKDNIPFHTIILPALLLAEGEKYRLPDRIVSGGHMTLEGRKISTSQNWAIWIDDLLNEAGPDSIRYFMLAHGPEKRDADFSRREFQKTVNGELVGVYGNLINRTLAFVRKYYGGIVPNGNIDNIIRLKIEALFGQVGEQIEAGEFKDALETVFGLARFGNKYFDEQKPWETRTTAPEDCRAAIYQCVQIVGNLAVLLEPFLPFSSREVMEWLGIERKWEAQYVPGGKEVPEIRILFERLEAKA